MVTIVGNNTIKLTKGDSLRASIGMKERSGGYYTPVEGDVITFAVVKRYEDTDPLIEKTIPNNTQELYLEPSDTSSLPLGSYFYDVQITYANGDVDTFIDKATFELTEKVPRSVADDS